MCVLVRGLLIACLTYVAVSVDVRYSGQWAPAGWEPRLLPVACVAALGLVSTRRRVLWAALIGMLADVSGTGWIGPQMCCTSLIAWASCLWLPSARRLVLSGFAMFSFLAAFCMSLTRIVALGSTQPTLEAVELSGRLAISSMVCAVLLYVLAAIVLRLLPQSLNDGSDAMQNRWPMLTG
jgi:hypothetical protein